MRRHDLTNKKTKTMTMKKTNTFIKHTFLSINFLSDAKRSKLECKLTGNFDKFEEGYQVFQLAEELRPGISKVATEEFS